ncbi:MnhB domain-containing protein [Candidatus Altiarchaeota archaeon]
MKYERRMMGSFVFIALAAIIMHTLAGITVEPGVNKEYIKRGLKVIPNQVTLVVLDYRGFDTLGECLVLVTGVLAVSMLYGRGSLMKVGMGGPEKPDLKPTLILESFTPYMVALSIAYGIYLTLGGHITPGGGFQGGSIIAAGGCLSLIIYGRKHMMEISHQKLVKIESAGLLLYLLIGLVGAVTSGYYLYNVGADANSMIAPGVRGWFEYPDGLNAGIIPYLNLAVMLKVSAGLLTILLVLLEVKK